MNILHLCSRYFPDRGGSETYTSSLAAGLVRLGVRCTMASATDPQGRYEHEGLHVLRFGTELSQSLGSLEQWLDGHRPDVLHFHTGSTRWSHGAIALARARGIPTALTYHHQALSCLRGDLMRFGLAQCSGLLTRENCAPCRGHQLGLPRSIAGFLNAVPRPVARLAETAAPGRVRTALQLPQSVEDAVAGIRAYLSGFSRIVVLADWCREMLLANGIDGSRIVVSRLGTHHEPPDRSSTRGVSGTIRGIYVGRLDPQKGVPMIAQALRHCDDLDLSIDVFGPPIAGSQHLAGPKLQFRGVLEDGKVVECMSHYDFALVPTQVLETGPFTVIEALQAGVPIIGSRLPAIDELLHHERNALLVTHDDPRAWASALRRITLDAPLREHLSRASRHDRSMDDVAAQMQAMYGMLATERQ